MAGDCPDAALGAAELVTSQLASLSSVNLIPFLTPLRVVCLPFLSVICFPVFAMGIPSRQDQSLPWPLAHEPAVPLSGMGPGERRG